MARGQGDGFDDVVTIERPRAKTQSSGFILQVADEPRHPTIVIDGTQRVLVGQSPVCHLTLLDREVSRRHASFDLEGTRLRVVDLGSTNGTYVNGIAVRDVSLVGSEIIRLGQTLLHVERIDASPPLLPDIASFGRVVGASSEMRRLYPLCSRIAMTSVPVILEGETGTGKEVLAESIHEQGPRANGPFVVFDCTTLPPNLLEGALFGHERGAFTGADTSRIGVFEEAHGGTLLIDEIGDLDIALQGKLLRAIERSEVRRLGGKGFVRVDVRVIAATRRDLDKEVQAGRFRDDLFFRLAVARVELPPLRARHGDVLLLTKHFWSSLGGEGEPSERMLARYDSHTWPGNVRELRNAVARYLALGEFAERDVMSSRLPSESQTRPLEGVVDSMPMSRPPDVFAHILALNLPLPRARQQLVDQFERSYVERVLSMHGGNVARAAKASGLARRYFQNPPCSDAVRDRDDPLVQW